MVSPFIIAPKAITEFNIAKPVGEGILQGVNMLDSSYHVGTNTIGQSLRNANRQVRSEPPNPQVYVSPWMNTTIGPDLPRRHLEVGDLYILPHSGVRVGPVEWPRVLRCRRP